MRFLIDMPLSPRLAEWLNKQGHDAVHAQGLGLSKASDSEILEFAIKDKRVVVTADLDYPRLRALMQLKGPGLVLFRGGNYTEHEVVERLTKTFETIAHQELPSSIVVIEKSRIRLRHLPI